MSFCKSYRILASLILLCIPLLSGCGDPAPIVTPVRIIAFGDSLTAGHNLPADAAFPAQLQARFLMDGHSGVQVLNQGISGDTTQDGIARLNKVIEAEPDIVILELGANDMLRNQPASKARENLNLIITELKQRNIIILLAGVPPSGVMTVANPRLKDYVPLYEDLATEHDLPLQEDFIHNVRGRREMNLSDGIHPNTAGITVMVENIYPTLLELAEQVAVNKSDKT